MKSCILTSIVLLLVIAACSVYANLNPNLNDHLGGEYFNIAQSLVAGQGFANPFDRVTGATAWQSPVYPLILAGFLRIFDGSHADVALAVVVLQVMVIIGTGLLVLALVRQTTTKIWIGAAAGIFFIVLMNHFWLCFEYTHDGWLILLTFDLLIAGVVWCHPLEGWIAAAAWGLFGGTAAMINPGVGLAWVLLSVTMAYRLPAWSHLGMAFLVATLTLAPWTIRNYLEFGRFIPFKSNLFYEMYQTQCLQADGLLQTDTFQFHPYRGHRPEAREFSDLGETAYLDRKREQFLEAVRADPFDYLDRVASRFLAATLWYVPFRRADASTRPWVTLGSRLLQPLPFLALLFLVATAFWRNLLAIQWLVISVYFIYLLPYIVASYYERYTMPLLAVKTLLVIWALDRLLQLVWRTK
jgi:hypothetical protein